MTTAGCHQGTCGTTVCCWWTRGHKLRRVQARFHRFFHSCLDLLVQRLQELRHFGHGTSRGLVWGSPSPEVDGVGTAALFNRPCWHLACFVTSGRPSGWFLFRLLPLKKKKEKKNYSQYWPKNMSWMKLARLSGERGPHTTGWLKCPNYSVNKSPITGWTKVRRINGWTKLPGEQEPHSTRWTKLTRTNWWIKGGKPRITVWIESPRIIG